jgi:hypothetical protein
MKQLLRNVKSQEENFVLGLNIMQSEKEVLLNQVQYFLTNLLHRKEKNLILQKKLEIRFLEVGTYEKQVQIYVDLNVAKSSKEELNKIEIKRLNFKFFW